MIITYPHAVEAVKALKLQQTRCKWIGHVPWMDLQGGRRFRTLNNNIAFRLFMKRLFSNLFMTAQEMADRPIKQKIIMIIENALPHRLV